MIWAADLYTICRRQRPRPRSNTVRESNRGSTRVAQNPQIDELEEREYFDFGLLTLTPSEGGGRCDLMISGETKPTPPVHPGGGCEKGKMVSGLLQKATALVFTGLGGLLAQGKLASGLFTEGNTRWWRIYRRQKSLEVCLRKAEFVGGLFTEGKSLSLFLHRRVLTRSGYHNIASIMYDQHGGNRRVLFLEIRLQ